MDFLDYTFNSLTDNKFYFRLILFLTVLSIWVTIVMQINRDILSNDFLPG